MRPLLALCLLGLAVPLAFADEPEPPRGDSSELVRQLGDASYRVRERAQQELLRRGVAALLDVKRGAESPDLEVRIRSRAILGTIGRSEADLFLEPFLAGKDDPAAALPGWTAVRGVMGDDETSRYLYAILYKGDRPLLEAFEKDPKEPRKQFDARLVKLQPAFNRAMRGRGAVKEAGDVTIEAVTGLLLIATASPSAAENDPNASMRLFGLLQQPAIQQVIHWSSAARRLTEKVIEQKCDDPIVGQQTLHLAQVYGCTELIEKRLRPATVKLVDAAVANPNDSNQVYRALNQARQLGMTDLIDLKLKPALLKGVTAAAKEPGDLNRLNQVASVAQSLGNMEEGLKTALRPAILELVKKQAQQPTDLNRFYTIVNLARMAQSQDLLDEHLRPAFRATLIRLSAQPKDFNALTQAFHQAQNLNMQDEIDTILTPAAEALVQTLAVPGSDANRLQQVLQLAQTFRLKETLRPVILKLNADAASKTPDLLRINILMQITRSAELPDAEQIIDNEFKPMARKSLVAAKDQPINAGTISQTLALGDQMQLKEVIDLAVKAAQTKTLVPHVRAQAITLIGKMADRAIVPQLEPLFADTGDIGASNISGVNIHGQVGDVALGAAVHLTGQKMDDYSFAWPKLAGAAVNQFPLPPHCYGFENDAARQASRAKWREWQSKK